MHYSCQTLSRFSENNTGLRQNFPFFGGLPAERGRPRPGLCALRRILAEIASARRTERMPVHLLNKHVFCAFDDFLITKIALVFPLFCL